MLTGLSGGIHANVRDIAFLLISGPYADVSVYCVFPVISEQCSHSGSFRHLRVSLRQVTQLAEIAVAM